jgi:coenzyme Q-binding protein COQ10
MGMKTHIEQKTLPYTAQQMFDLVAAVDKYVEFAPWCVASRITKRESESVFYADLVVGYKMLRERFTSKVILVPPPRQIGTETIQNANEIPEIGEIYIEYLRGPLRQLKNRWRFTQNRDGSCTIDFHVEFEFKNNVLQGMAQMFFQEIVKRMVSAFEARAAVIYQVQ